MCFFSFILRKKKKHFHRIIKNPILENNQEECPICLELLNTQFCMETISCNHIFHYDCYNKYIQTQMNKNKYIIECPLCQTPQQ